MERVLRLLTPIVLGVLMCGLPPVFAGSSPRDQVDTLPPPEGLPVEQVKRPDSSTTPPSSPLPGPTGGCSGAVDYKDPTYGAPVRRLENPDGDEHGLYYHRNQWNADSSAMVAAWEDPEVSNWDLVLLDRHGCYLQTLFAANQYDWRLVWDREDPEILYTWHGKTVYRYDVTTRVATPVKMLSAPVLSPGVSLSQDNSKLLVITGESIPVLRVLRVSDWAEVSKFTITKDGKTFKGTTDCQVNWNDVRFIGYRDFIYAACRGKTTATRLVRIFDGSGALYHEFSGWKYSDHTDFSPDGRYAYFEVGNGVRIHVVNIDGTNDTIVFNAPKADVQWIQNLHISWPDRVPDYFFVSFFPSADKPAPPDAPLSDELMIVHTSGIAVSLARTHGSSKPFWSQGLASPNADGTLVSFSSNRCPVAGDPCANTIDLNIVTVPASAIDP
jgi:hypothetical protein